MRHLPGGGRKASVQLVIHGGRILRLVKAAPGVVKVTLRLAVRRPGDAERSGAGRLPRGSFTQARTSEAVIGLELQLATLSHPAGSGQPPGEFGSVLRAVEAFRQHPFVLVAVLLASHTVLDVKNCQRLVPVWVG